GLALAVARVEVFGEAAGLARVLRLEQLDDGARRVHAPRRVDARPDAEAEVEGARAPPVAHARDLPQRAHARVRRAVHALEAERDDGAVLARELRHVRHRPDGDDL